MATAYCPHCFLILAEDVTGPYPTAPIRCRHCQLLVGPGRARPEPEEDHRGRGSAAGVYASAARHAGAPPRNERAVVEAIREVADVQGCPVERLLMLDYQRHAERRPSLPPLGSVLSTFGSWKAARRRAADATAAGRAR